MSQPIPPPTDPAVLEADRELQEEAKLYKERLKKIHDERAALGTVPPRLRRQTRKRG